MSTDDIILLVLVGVAALTLLGLFIWKNQKDKKEINPDAADITEETRMDNARKGSRR